MFRIWQKKRLHYHLIFVELELQEQKKMWMENCLNQWISSVRKNPEKHMNNKYDAAISSSLLLLTVC